MIREDTHGRRAMGELTVAGVEPVHIAADAAHWGKHAGNPPRQQPRGRRSSLPNLLSAALPHADPEQCEMVYQLDGLGQIVGVFVRDIDSGATIATFDLAELSRLVAATGQSGVLFETRG